MDKVELLLKNYQVLKNSKKMFDGDYLRPIVKVLEKMFKYDFDIGVKLWLDMLNTEKKYYIKADSYDSNLITTYVASRVEDEKKDDYKTVLKLIMDNKIIGQAIFQYSSDLDYTAPAILWQGIVSGQYDIVYSSAELVMKNSIAEEKLADFVIDWVEHLDEDYLMDSTINKEDVVQFIFSITDLIIDDEDKARATTALIEFL